MKKSHICDSLPSIPSILGIFDETFKGYVLYATQNEVQVVQINFSEASSREKIYRKSEKPRKSAGNAFNKLATAESCRLGDIELVEPRKRMRISDSRVASV